MEIGALDKIAAPGFLDVHIHGAGGHDVMEGHRSSADGGFHKDRRTWYNFVRRHHGDRDPEMICKSAEGIAKYICSQQHTAEPAAPKF